MSKYNTIYVVHFKEQAQQSFDAQDTDYCKPQGQSYPYTIKYHNVNINILSDNLDRFISFISSLSQLNQSDNQVLFIIDTVDQHSSYKALLIIQRVREYVKNFTLYVLQQIILPPISVKFLLDGGIVFKKVLNVYFSDSVSKGLVTGVETKTYIRVFRKEDTNKLICLEWFMYFSDTAFGCVSRRLLQMSGTCYLNSVINGIILTPVMRNFVLDRMSILRAFDTTPLDIDVCRIKDQEYFFRLVYNMACSKVSLKDIVHKQDIMAEFSKIYSSNPKDPGQGGYVSSTLKRLLNLIEDKTPIVLSYKDNVLHEYIPGSSKKFLFISDIRNDKVINDLNYNDTDFQLQFAIINFVLKGSAGHSVVGIICEGQYIIFDSNGFIINLDWTRLLVDEDIRKTFYEFIQKYTGGKEVIISIYSIYANKSTVDKYKYIDLDAVCNTIDIDDMILDKYVLETGVKLPREKLLLLKQEPSIIHFPIQYRPILLSIKDENTLNYALALILAEEPTPEKLIEDIGKYNTGNTTIYFFHISGSIEEDSFTLHSNYCETNNTYYPYDIRYYTISYRISEQGLSKLTNVLHRISNMNQERVKMIFYSNGDWLNIETMIDILENAREHTENAVVLINHKDNHDTTFYLSSDDIAKHDIRVKQLVNIEYNDYPTKDGVKIDDESFNIMSFSLSGDNKRELICNTWFRYFAIQV